MSVLICLMQLLRKSVETRDWLNTIEPRTVRAVMKRVIEDITAIDTLVGQLFEEGVKKERSSDSSRRTLNYSSASKHPSKHNWTYAARLVNVTTIFLLNFSFLIQFLIIFCY